MNNKESNLIFIPPTEISENGDNYTITMEIPGLDKADIKIWLENNELTVIAEKKLDSEGRLYAERIGGSFARWFVLPENVEAAKMEAEYVDGVIKIVIPKSEKSRARTITIK